MTTLRINNKLIHAPLLEVLHKIRAECHNGKLAVIKPLGTDIQVSCPNPNHKGGHESKPSGGVYVGAPNSRLQYGTYHCLACDSTCSFEHFTAMCFECSDERASQWLVDNFADEDLGYAVDLPEITLATHKPAYLDDSILNTFQDFHPYMLTRKLNIGICKRFEIKYDPKTECLAFPVRDEKNNLVMFTRRSVKEKKFIIDKDKEKPLYLLKYALEDSPNKFMITEGQIDAATAYGYGMPCVATMGAISDHQIELINKSGVRILYLMFDCDAAGKSFKDKLTQRLRKDILAIPVPIMVAGKKDINDLTKEEFWQCVKYAENNCI